MSNVSDIAKSIAGALSMLLILLMFTDSLFISAIALSFSGFVFLLFFFKLGKSIPVIELMLLIACLQWIIGPFAAYSLGNNHWKYYMSLPEEYYMNFILAAIILFAIGLILFYRKIQVFQVGLTERTRHHISLNSKMPFVLVLIGLLAHTLIGLVPVSLRFVLNLLDGMQFIGVFYLFFADHKLKWPALISVLVLNFAISLSMGLFHNLIIWLVFIFLYLNRIYRFNYINNLILISVGFYFLFLLQGIKDEYRETLMGDKMQVSRPGEPEANVEVFGRMLTKQMASEDAEDLSFLEMINVRLNQGWIISRILYYVPKYAPYANGETIEDAVEASLLPRFIDPEKKKAGGKDNYERFTGFLLDDTSMGVSIVGEAYANYGYDGALVFMLIWGFVVGLTILMIFRLSLTYPTLWIWIPLIFNQVIKAETDLVVVLNHLTKSLVLVLLIFLISRNILSSKI